MSKELTYQASDENTLRAQFVAAFDMAKRAVNQGIGVEFALRRLEQKRSLSQNAKMWPMLEDVSRQKQLCIDGEMVWADEFDWKDVFTSALRKHQRVAKGIDGGVVMLGMHTSRMKKGEFSELIELMYAFGAENGIQWSEKSLKAYEQYREVAS